MLVKFQLRVDDGFMGVPFINLLHDLHTSCLIIHNTKLYNYSTFLNMTAPRYR